MKTLINISALAGLILVSTIQARTFTGIVTTASNTPLQNATIVIDNKKVVTNETGQYSYTTNATVNSFVVYKSGFQFKKVNTVANTDNYTVKLDSAVYSKEFAPPLRVLGGMIYNAKDQPVLLQGVSIHEAPNLRESDFVNWANNWKINVVRLVMHNHERKEDQWPSYLDKVDSALKWAKKYKIYVLVDGYHEAGSSGSVVSHWDRVQVVWDKLMPRLKNYDHVIWQIYNEPNGDGGNNWTAWAPYAKILVDKIRSHKPVVNAIAVPAAVWATDLDLTKVAFDREEIIFSFHPYYGRPSPHKPAMWDKAFGYLQKQDIAPVFASEWAAHNGGGDTANQLNTYFRPIMRYFKDNDIHFSHWGYFPSWGGMPNLVSSNIGSPEKRTQWGDLLFNYFNGVQWDSLMALPSIPGKIESEDFDGFDGLRTENTSDQGGGKNLAYITNNSWSAYTVNTKSTTGFKFSIRAASGSSGGKVTVYVDGQKKTSVDIPSTGGWQVWKTFTAPDNFLLQAGDHTIKLVYTGGSSIFNLNWFSLDETPVAVAALQNATSAMAVSLNGNTLTISLPSNGKASSVSIHQINGKMEKQLYLDNTNPEVSISELVQGTYVIKVNSDEWQFQKIIAIP